jgi:hypothetical protein
MNSIAQKRDSRPITGRLFGKFHQAVRKLIINKAVWNAPVCFSSKDMIAAGPFYTAYIKL